MRRADLLRSQAFPWNGRRVRIVPVVVTLTMLAAAVCVDAAGSSTAAVAAPTTTTSPVSGCLSAASAPMSPKPDFDPLTASDQQLLAADFPSRPTRPDQLAVWKGYVQDYLAGKVVHCGLPTASDTDLPAMGSYNAMFPGWAGYYANGQSWTDAVASFNANGVAAGPQGYRVGYWAGVNFGGSGHTLIQAGAQAATGQGLPACDLWWEAFPVNAAQPIATCTPGDFIYVHVAVTTSGLASWHVVDESSQPKLDFSHGPLQFSAAPDGHAGAIVEQSCFGPCPPDFYGLANFGSTNLTQQRFSGAETYAAPNWQFEGSNTNQLIYFNNNGNNAPSGAGAAPTGIDSFGNSGVVWVAPH